MNYQGGGNRILPFLLLLYSAPGAYGLF